MPQKEDILLLDNQICFPLYAASRMVTKLYGPILSSLDITYPQYLVLLALWEEDKQTVSSISERLYLETNTITPLLKRMEQKELVSRKRSQHDERSVVIALTTKGKRMKKKAVCIPQQIVNSLHDERTDPAEVLAFKDTLHKIVHLLAEKEIAEG